jgi:hypothetical protein
MKIKRRLLVFLPTLAAIAAMVVTVSAQRAGFQAAGIAPPVQHQHMLFGRATPVAPFTMGPVAPFVTAPVAPFGVAPGGRVLETFHGVPQVFFPPVQPPAVVIPRQSHSHRGFGFRARNTFVTVPQVFPQVFPESNIGLPAVGPIPTMPPTISTIPPTISSIPQTISTFPPTISTAFPVGTSRAHVISQLGSPSVTVITSTGETLYFSGGLTVMLENGQVVTGAR